MTPLTDLGSGQYCGFTGGLYPDGRNTPPAQYAEIGLRVGTTLQPLDKDGEPFASGKIGMISIGMSNGSREFSEFVRLVEAGRHRNPNLLLVDGALEGASASKIALPGGDYWKHVDRQVQHAQITPAQVQVAWIKPAEGYEIRAFPESARALQGALCSMVEILRTRFPLLKLVYISSRIYGGYSEIRLNPEPIAYESGFAVKWMIEDRINDPNVTNLLPWVSWGPYLWANGLKPRSDGLTWERSDFEPDGVHPSPQGAQKVAAMLLEFCRRDAAVTPWFHQP